MGPEPLPRACAKARRPCSCSKRAPIDDLHLDFATRADASVVEALTGEGGDHRRRDRRQRPAACSAERRLLRRCGDGRPDVDRRLPGARRLRGAPPRDGARPGGDGPGDRRREAARSRRRRVPDRRQVEGGRRAVGAPALRDLQRRRIRARDLQGPGRDGVRSLRGDRGAHDRRVRDRGREGLPVHPRGVPARDRTPRTRDRRGAAPRVPGRGRDGARRGLRHRAATRRRRLHLRRGDGAVQLDRGQARRAAEQAAVPGDPRRLRQADRDQQRGDPAERAADPRARRRGIRQRSAPKGRPAPGCSASPGTWSAPASTSTPTA